MFRKYHDYRILFIFNVNIIKFSKIQNFKELNKITNALTTADPNLHEPANVQYGIDIQIL